MDIQKMSITRKKETNNVDTNIISDFDLNNDAFDMPTASSGKKFKRRNVNEELLVTKTKCYEKYAIYSKNTENAGNIVDWKLFRVKNRLELFKQKN